MRFGDNQKLSDLVGTDLVTNTGQGDSSDTPRQLTLVIPSGTTTQEYFNAG